MKWLIILLLPLVILMFGCKDGGPDYRYQVSHSITKYEDKAEGIVCYMYYSASISCVKR